MTQLERFTSLLDEMNVHYVVEPLVFNGKPTGDTFVSIPSRAKGFVNWAAGDGTDVVFNEFGTCTNWT